MNRFAYHVPILGYHRVGNVRSDHVPTVSAEAFERQLKFLTHYRVVSLEEVVGYVDRGQPVPRRSVVITFDDGYAETHTIAWPLLKRFGLPATVFITPAEVGAPGFVTWEQVVEMSEDGITIGSHTMHHSYLPMVSEDRLHEELVESKQVIEQHLNQPVRFISYPVGGFTLRAQAIVKEAGYRAACTTNRTFSREVIDRFALRRIKVTERDGNGLLFWFKVSGYYDAFRQLKDAGERVADEEEAD